MTATQDPVELIPEPDALQQMLADSVKRSDLLRGLIRVARRKAAYGRPAGIRQVTSGRPDLLTSEAQPAGVVR